MITVDCILDKLGHQVVRPETAQGLGDCTSIIFLAESHHLTVFEQTPSLRAACDTENVSIT